MRKVTEKLNINIDFEGLDKLKNVRADSIFKVNTICSNKTKIKVSILKS